MGVFLYSNKTVDASKVAEVFTSRGHKKVTSENLEESLLVHAPKIFVDNVNFLSGNALGGKNDFILGIGTYFYDGKYGEDALREVWENLDEVLTENPVYGHWAFVAHKNETTYIFNDWSGVLRLYYAEQDGKIVVSSSMTAIIATMQNPKFDRVRLSAFLAGGYGNEIPFVEGLYDVDPMTYLVIKDGGKPEWKKRFASEVKRIETTEEAVAYVKGLFGEQMRQLKAIGDERISIELTAGLDSRLIASNLKTSGFNYEFLNYPLFGSDAEVSKLIADGLGKRILVQTNEPCTNEQEKHVGEFDYGFNYLRQYANPRWKIENVFQFSGARGECLDLPDIYSDEDINMMNDPRPEALLPRLTIRAMMDEGCKKDYEKYIVAEFERRGFKRDVAMTEQQQVEFGQILCGQKTGDYMYNSGVQAHIYFYQIYNEWHFNHNITNIAFDAKSGRKLTLALIKAIDPELGSYPFVSRRRTKRKSVNETTELPKQYFGYGGIKAMLPKWVVNKLYERMGRSFSKERFAAIDFDRYRDVVKVDELKRHRNLYSGTLNRMFSVEVLRKKYGIEN